MRTYVRIFCGLFLLATVLGLPADPKPTETRKLARVNLEKDVEEFPVRQYPLEGFLGGFNDLFERMRQQMLFLMSQIPRIGFGTPPEGGNTTSVTKVIDGHKVIINETVYSSGDGEDAAAIFKVRVIDIRPDGSGETEETPSVVPETPKSSIESIELSQENEIPKGSRSIQKKRKVNSMEFEDNEVYNGLESFDDSPTDNIETFDDIDNSLETFDEPSSEDNLETFDEPLDNRVETFDEEDRPIIDLSNDIYVNELAEGEGRKPHPDVEVFSYQEPPRDLSRDTYINEIAANYGRQPHPDAETFDPSSNYINPGRDLSRDTYVNELAYGRGVPFNPDAELLDGSPRSRYYYRTENR